MMVKKTFLLSVSVLFGYAFSNKLTRAAEDTAPDTGDKELMSKLLNVVQKCFKDVDWNTCGEMLKIEYDITQPKYKQCTCHMACVGEELGMINNGEPDPAKFLDYVKMINNKDIKSQMQNIHDKCQTVKGTEKCDLAEKFTKCAFQESPTLKERMSMLIETMKKMKGN